MKKILLVFAFIYILLISSCFTFDNKNYNIKVSLDEENEVATLSFQTVDNATSYRLTLIHGSIDTSVSLDEYQINDEDVSFVVNNIYYQFEYLYEAYVDNGYVKILNDKVNMKNYITDLSSKFAFNLYLQEGIITVVDIDLNLNKYTVSEDFTYYTASIRKPLDYVYVITDVLCKDSYTFHKNVVFKVKGKVITKGLTVTSDKITYRTEDVNWSPFY